MPRDRALTRPQPEEVHAHGDLAVSRLSARQHRALSVAELHGCGLDDDAILVRTRNGRLHRRFRGVYAVGDNMLSLAGCFLAAVKACGPGAVLSHFSAAVLWGLLKWDGRDPEVTAPHPRRHKGIKAHRSTHIERVYRNGILVTPVARTLIDISATAPQKQLRRAVNEALNKRLIKPYELVTSKHRGAKKLRAILVDAAPTMNDFEDLVLPLVRNAGLPRPLVNQPFLNYRPDFRWPEHHVILETDGAATHDQPLARADDARRQAVLEAYGYTVLRTTWRELVGQPATVMRALDSALRGSQSQAADEVALEREVDDQRRQRGDE
jgi:very-short-patch-repair endonuclease